MGGRSEGLSVESMDCIMASAECCVAAAEVDGVGMVRMSLLGGSCTTTLMLRAAGEIGIGVGIRENAMARMWCALLVVSKASWPPR